MPYIGSSPPVAPVTSVDITDGSIANTDMDTGSITPHALASGAVTALGFEQRGRRPNWARGRHLVVGVKNPKRWQ